MNEILEHPDLVRRLIEAGVCIDVQVHWRGWWGGSDGRCIDSVSDAEEWLSDRDAFAAKTMGCTKSQYQEWIAVNGCVRCCAKTKSGRQCKNDALDMVHLELHEWIKLNSIGGRCWVHSNF